MAKAKSTAQKKATFGGPQPGSGPRTRYPGKVLPPKSIALTQAAHRRLEALAAENDASESDIVCNLLLESKIRNLPDRQTAGAK